MSDLSRRAVKILDLGYLSTIYLSIAIVATVLLNKISRPLDFEEAERESVWPVIGQIVLHVWALTLVAYAARALAKNIPSPLDGVAGHSHAGVRELTAFPVFAAMLFLNSKDLKDKLSYVFWRVEGRKGEFKR